MLTTNTIASGPAWLAPSRIDQHSPHRHSVGGGVRWNERQSPVGSDASKFSQPTPAPLPLFGRGEGLPRESPARSRRPWRPSRRASRSHRRCRPCAGRRPRPDRRPPRRRRPARPRGTNAATTARPRGSGRSDWRRPCRRGGCRTGSGTVCRADWKSLKSLTLTAPTSGLPVQEGLILLRSRQLCEKLALTIGVSA